MKKAVAHPHSDAKEGRPPPATSVAELDRLRAVVSALLLAEDRERKHLAADVHDNLAQFLILCRMKLGLLASHVQAPQAIDAFNDVKRFLDDALRFTRTMMCDLHPVLAGDADDLRVAIAWVVDKVHRQGLKVTVEDDGEWEILDEDLLIVAYQSMHELLINVVKHANAREASLKVRRSQEGLDICIDDRGKGFDVSGIQDPLRAGGFGLFIIRERLDLLGGRLEITSAKQKGTRARLLIPLGKDRR